MELSADEIILTKSLIAGTLSMRTEFESILEKYTKNWKVNRLPKIDLTILLLGLYELKSMPKVSTGNIINDYVELSKIYSQADSKAFINGTLDNIAKNEFRK